METAQWKLEVWFSQGYAFQLESYDLLEDGVTIQPSRSPPQADEAAARTAHAMYRKRCIWSSTSYNNPTKGRTCETQCGGELNQAKDYHVRVP
ncbi:hypothetical protein KIN20_020404 [Parelaphostrongylus tenuis]|uniref:Uncharacterized protein n=1 Tax=Parelaphostrongylus tenuis TaxID=148309 RepID=A0AAD5N420_PARTN|nr:hypothetical protein KIN20_020404 [Parelaphostrongylus tenuis]